MLYDLLHITCVRMYSECHAVNECVNRPVTDIASGPIVEGEQTGVIEGPKARALSSPDSD